MLSQKVYDLIVSDLPEGIAGLRSKEWYMPQTNPAPPTDVDEAVIEMGKLACGLNTALTRYNGFLPVEALLRVGQLNATLIGILLAQVQKNSTIQELQIKITQPSEGENLTVEQEFNLTVRATVEIESLTGADYALSDSENHKVTGVILQSQQYPGYFDDKLLVPPNFVVGTMLLEINVYWTIDDSNYQKSASVSLNLVE